jgi:hypothetical protein
LHYLLLLLISGGGIFLAGFLPFLFCCSNLGPVSFSERLDLFLRPPAVAAGESLGVLFAGMRTRGERPLRLCAELKRVQDADLNDGTTLKERLQELLALKLLADTLSSLFAF